MRYILLNWKYVSAILRIGIFLTITTMILQAVTSDVSFGQAFMLSLLGCILYTGYEIWKDTYLKYIMKIIDVGIALSISTSVLQFISMAVGWIPDLSYEEACIGAILLFCLITMFVFLKHHESQVPEGT